MVGARWTRFHDSLAEDYAILRPGHPSYRWLVLTSVMIGTFMAVLDATIVNVALSKLIATFGVSVDQGEWVLTAYLLVFGVVLPSSGWFADHFGYKKMFLFGLFFFVLGSFLCSLSWSLDVLIAFRIVQGAGAGFVMPIGLALITREFPPEKRGVALGFWSMSASASVSLGPTLGGYLIDNFSWHAIFDVNVPIGILGMIFVLIILREHRVEAVRKFDVVGFASLTVFLTSLLLALSNGNSEWNTGGWTSTFILTSFGIAAVGLVVFLSSTFSNEHPIIELGLLRNHNFGLSNLVFFIFGLGVFGSIFLLPIYLQDSLGYTPLQAGLVFLPVGVIQGIVAPLAGVFADRASAKIPAALGLFLMAVSFYQYSSLSFLTERAAIMFPLYLRGIAIGLIFAPLTQLALSGVPMQKLAQASGMFNVIRQIGASVGVAVFGSFLIRRNIFHTAMYGGQIDAHSPVYQKTVAGLAHFAAHADGSSSATAAVQAKALLVGFIHKQAFIQAVDDVFLIAGAVLLVSVIPVLFLHGRTKSRAATPSATQTKTG